MDNRWLILAPGLATAISLALGLWLGYAMQGRRLTAVFAAAPLLLPPTLIGAWFLLPSFTLPVAVLAGSVFGLPFLAAVVAHRVPTAGSGVPQRGARPGRLGMASVLAGRAAAGVAADSGRGRNSVRPHGN